MNREDEARSDRVRRIFREMEDLFEIERAWDIKTHQVSSFAFHIVGRSRDIAETVNLEILTQLGNIAETINYLAFGSRRLSGLEEVRREIIRLGANALAFCEGIDAGRTVE